MYFAHAPHASGSKTTKLALVVVFHVILGFALVKTMNTKLLSLPMLTPDVVLVPPVDPPVVIPPTVTLPDPPPLVAPRIVVPVTEVQVTTPPPNTVTTTTTTISDPQPPTQPPGPAITPSTQTGGTGATAVRTAAMLAGCAKPAYPAQAARNGDSGTVTLALLVGVDGRVTGSRIERSSGFRDLDKAALTALSQCTFKPAMLGDVAQAGWTQLAYVWTLE